MRNREIRAMVTLLVCFETTPLLGVDEDSAFLQVLPFASALSYLL